jgi:hypothetical protein
MKNSFMTLKNAKNQTQPETENQPELMFVFSRTFKAQEHLT